MDRKPVRMIALDLDGTLLGPDGQVGARNLAALQAAEEAGIAVVIATGRRHFYALKVLRHLPLKTHMPLITSNGAVVRTFDSELLERTQMNLDSVRRLCGKLGEYRDALVVTFDRINAQGEDEHGALVVEELDGLHSSIAQWMQANEAYIDRFKPIERCLEHEAPIQMMLCGSIDRMRRAEQHMMQDEQVSSVLEPRAGALLQLSRTEYLERDLSLLDVVPAGCSKGTAILRLAATRGITAEEVMAIGDNWNDASMLEMSGWPVLMGNAPAELAQVAEERGWLRTTTHAQDGVAEAILTHCLQPLGLSLAGELAHVAETVGSK